MGCMYTVQIKGKSRGEQDNDLMEEVLSRQNMLKALRRVKKNKGAPGIDNLIVESLRLYLSQNWLSIRSKLLKGDYKPQPVLRIEIPKPNGGKRLLGIPTVIDRLIQQALLQILTEIFDHRFSPFSFGFRPNRKAHDAVIKAKQYIEGGIPVGSRFRHREILFWPKGFTPGYCIQCFRNCSGDGTKCYRRYEIF